MTHVLLVDDDASYRRSLAIGLETQGYQVFEVKSGMEALEFLQSNQKTNKRIDGVIVDARMPGLDGFWLTDQILVMYPDLKVIILSAHPYPTNFEKYTFLTKPIDIQMLIDTLEKKVIHKNH